MRKYEVQIWSWNDKAPDKLKAGRTSSFKISDKYEHETDKERPCVATFEVNAIHDEDLQLVRARKLCEYLNSVNDKMNMYDILTNSNIV